MATPSDPSIQVVLVEDDAAIADMLRLLLEAEGYGVTWCASAAATLAFLAPRSGAPPSDGAPSPAVLLLDLALGDASGVVLMEQLRERLPRLPPVVLLSAGAEADVQAAAHTVGAVATLHKPFDPVALLALLAAVTTPAPARVAPSDPPASPSARACGRA